MLIFSRSNCIFTASVTFTLGDGPYITLFKRELTDLFFGILEFQLLVYPITGCHICIFFKKRMSISGDHICV